MRNLKRALSLTLASVMLLGMMVLGTSAASYPDVTDEHNVEAIEVLQAIGVMTGSNSGNFNPDAKVSRIEMAIVMANLLDLDVNYFAGQNNFSDVPEWASGYVNACAANGIVTGVGGGRFGTGNVTATQAALMMLKALGYFQYNSDFGSDWARATANQAAKINLFDDLDVRDNTQLTRNQVAQLALNALESTMVDADDNTLHITTGADAGGIDITGGSVKYVVRSSSNTKVSQAINRDEKNSSAVTGLQGDTVELGEQLFQGDLRKEDAVGTADDFGRPGVKWTYKSETIGTYANSTSSVFTKRVNANDIYKVIGKSVTDDLKSGRYTLNNYVDGQCTTIAKGDIDNYSHRDNSTKVNGSGNGMVTEVYVNTQDRIVTIVSYNTFVFKAVNDYSESRGNITVARAGNTDITLLSNIISDADFDLTDIKADDYLLITGVKGTSGRYDPQTLAKAELIQGVVDGYKFNDSVTIAGNSYGYSLTTKDSGTDPVKSTRYTVGQEAAVVLDKYGYIIAVDEAVISSNYVYVSEFAQPSGLSNGRIAASAFFTDGTSKDITVKEAYNYGTKAMTSDKVTIDNLPGNWYTYSVNSSDEYTLYRAETKYTVDTANYNGASGSGNKIAENNKVNFLTTNGKTAVSTETANTARANDKTIVVVNDVTNSEVMIYNGVSSIPDMVLYNGATAKVNLLRNSSSYAYYVYIEVKGNTSVSNEDSNLLYVLKYDGEYRTTDNKRYYTYKVLDGVAEKVVEADSVISKLGSGDIYKAVHKARTNSDKRITSVEDVLGASTNKLINGTGTSITEDDGALTIGGNSYTMGKDATITLILMGKDLDGDGKTAAARMKDAKKDYEIQTVTAKELADLMKGYTLDYDFQGKVTDNGGSVISELFVTVKEATTSGGGDTPGGSDPITGEGTKVNGQSTIAKINEELAKGDVVLTGTFAPTGVTPDTAVAINIPANTTLTITGNVIQGTGTASGGVKYVFLPADKTSKVQITGTYTTKNVGDINAAGTWVLGGLTMGVADTIATDVTINGDFDVQTNATNISGNVIVTGGDVKGSGVITVNGNLTVNGQQYIATPVTVLSEKSLHARQAEMRAKLIVGDASHKGLAEIGTLTSASEVVVVNGEAKVVTEIACAAEKITGAKNGKITFERNAAATGTAKEVFKDADGSIVSVGDKEFTFNSATDTPAEVKPEPTEPTAPSTAVSAEIIFIYDEASWNAAKAAGASERALGGATWSDLANTQKTNNTLPWMFVKVTRDNTDIGTLATVTVEKQNGSNWDEVAQKAGGTEVEDTSIDLSGLGERLFFFLHWELATKDPADSSEDTQTLAQARTDAAVNGTYRVTITYKVGDQLIEKAVVTSPATYGSGIYKVPSETPAA